MTTKKIFISYAWKDEDTVDTIDNAFKSVGITLIRDKRDLNYCQNIKDFMKTIRNADYALMIISNSYLKSKNCMYEVLEFVKDENYKDKILPVLLEDCNDIFDIKGQSEYIKFWQEEYNKNKEHLSEIDLLNSPSLINELKIIDNISKNIGEFLSTISNMKLISLQNLQEQNYKPILNRIGFDNTSLVVELIEIFKLTDTEEQDLAIEKLQIKYSTSYLLFYFKAIIETKRNNFKKAKAYFESSIKLNTNFAATYNSLATLLHTHFKDYDKAKEYYNIAITLDNNDQLAYINFARLLSGHFKDYAKAKKYYNTAITLNPYNADAHMDLAALLSVNFDDKEQSNIHLAKAIELNPKLAESYNINFQIT